MHRFLVCVPDIEGVSWVVGCVPEVEVPDEFLAGCMDVGVRFGQVPEVDGVGNECGEMDDDDDDGGVAGFGG